VLLLAGPDASRVEDELRAGPLAAEAGVVVLPTAASLSAKAQARLRTAGHMILPLSDTVGLSPDGELRTIQDASVVLESVRRKLHLKMAGQGTDRAWALPADARWPELTFRLLADEAIAVSFRGKTQQLDPDALGMRHARSRKPTRSWAMLQVLAMAHGAAGITDRSQEAKLQRQFQLLGSAMVDAFGIRPSPIRWDRQEQRYKAAFVISDERPLAVRRKFAGGSGPA
jgi:hypothetical protein